MFSEKSIQLMKITDEMKQNYERRLQVKCPNLIQTYNVDFQRLSEGCMSGKYEFVTGQWEYPGITTLYDVNQYKETAWTEPQLWEIGSQIIDGCASLEKAKLIHGDLRPEKIFVSNKQIKLAVRVDFEPYPLRTIPSFRISGLPIRKPCWATRTSCRPNK